MTTKSDTDISDIASMIGDLATMIDERFEQVDKHFEQVDKHFEQVDERFEQVDKRFDSMEKDIRDILAEQRKLREWIESIDNRVMGIESDIKEIYDRIVTLENKSARLTKSEAAELSDKFEKLIDWAHEVSRRTGVALPKL